MTKARDLAVWRRLALVAAMGVCAAQAWGGAKDKRLDIYWVDVEGGAATLIVTPSGESVLVDTGLDGERDPGRIARLAREVARIKQIDHLVVTHFDVDHHGGAAELARRIPIRKVYDPGGARGRSHASYDKYLAFRKTVPYAVLKPGDTIPLRPADGAAKVSLVCLAAGGKLIPPGPEHKKNPLAAAKLPEYPVDRSENAHSVVLLLRFGAFDFLDPADLTGRLEGRLVWPRNLAGEVDVYQVDHHGLDMSNNPVLIQSIRPTVTVMNNGHRKGCGPKTRAALRAVDSIRANYQLHKNLKSGADNTADEYIANFEPAQTCKGNRIELHVAPDGREYTVEIPATKHKRTFPSKPSSLEAKQAADAFLGDWQGRWGKPGQAGGPIAAQVIPRGGGKYRVNIVPEFDKPVRPLAVVEATAAGGVLRFDQAGWGGRAEAGRLTGTGRHEGKARSFEMKKVTRLSPRLGAKPPEGAIVLFDGTGFDHWEANRGDPKAIPWKLADGCARIWPPLVKHAFGTAIRTKKAYPNFQMHLEFRLPLLAGDTGQTRANSGVIIEEFEFYEVQILDSYGLAGGNQECGSIYGRAAPKVNMCAPPLQWQSYDITYRAPRFDASGKLTQPARLTVDHNGKRIHDNLALPFRDRALKARLARPGSRKPGRITLQHHGDVVEFRNMWLLELEALQR